MCIVDKALSRKGLPVMLGIAVIPPLFSAAVLLAVQPDPYRIRPVQIVAEADQVSIVTSSAWGMAHAKALHH